MTVSILEHLRSLESRATPLPIYARNRHLSRVRDNTGMGATLPTNHIGVMAEREDAELFVAMRNALPALLRLAEVSLKVRDGRYSIKTTLDRHDRTLFDEFSVAIDEIRFPPSPPPAGGTETP